MSNISNGNDKPDVDAEVDVEVNAEHNKNRNDFEKIEKSHAMKDNRNVKWYLAPTFILTWLAIFFAIVYPVYFYLPEGVRIVDAENESEVGSCRFVAERAYNVLYDYDSIGEKVSGSFANENVTIELILTEIKKIRASMNHDLYDLELDVQVATGGYLHWHMINMYQDIQNVVVKLSPKNSKSEKYLLINSHFDSKPGSPGTGDDGAMMVIMLEVLRLLSSSKCGNFRHPIVFLFNGAEETPLQGSHAFITQHKWAPNCAAVINLDSAGSGLREILFQGAPNHPWLMKYYAKYVKSPYATTVAEELFQSGLIPSDTDFRIFKNFGKIPGLDIAHSYNGYVYHTKFDKINVIPLGTLQVTGDHMLSLARGLANAPELENTSKYKGSHAVFYDFLNQFFIHYPEHQGKIINYLTSLAAIILSAIFLWVVPKRELKPISTVLQMFGLIFLLHFVAFLLAFGIPLVIATLYDLDNRSMTWFTNKWLILGQYIIPALFGLSMPTVVYISLQQKKDDIPRSYKIQMVLHAHSTVLALLCIALTFIGIRSSYLLMISIFFYDIFVVFNLASSTYNRGYWWMIPLIVSQIMPFLYYTHLFFGLISSNIPMFGRFGSNNNPDLFVAGICAFAAVLSMGFLILTLSAFERAKTILVCLVGITFIFIMISLSVIGFPYRPATNVGRLNFLNVHRVFYGFDGTVERNESGFYFDFQDRRKHTQSKDAVDFTELRSVSDDCAKELMCGVPLFNHRWYKARKQGMWLPSADPIQIPGYSTLTLSRKSVDAAKSTVRYDFVLKGPKQRSIFMQPFDGVRLTNSTFMSEKIGGSDKWKMPYHLFYSCGKTNPPLKFYFEFSKPDGRFDVPIFKLGISGHYISSSYPRGETAKKFIKSFPNYLHIMEWPSSYERYIF